MASLLSRALAALAVTGAGLLAHAGCSTPPSFEPEGHGGGTATSSTSTSMQACQTADDCPGDDDECSHRSCDAGRCAVEFAPDGFLVGAQASGDCMKSVCDGNGAVKTVPDDSDVPSDGNACTTDVCTNGVPSHPPTDSGSACGATGQLQCDGAGNCAGCTADADCGADGECASYTCNTTTTTCAIAYVPNGQGNPSGQQGGDCKKVVCNGNGGTAIANDDADVPDDGNACTNDVCTAGKASHPPAPSGTACGDTFECDGKGACGGCVTNADCGQDGACASFQCNGGTCQVTFVPSGQGDPGGQTSGDCQKVVCNGNGGTTTIADDADVPSDGNACTKDTCTNGVPSNPPLASGTSCGAGLQCDGAGGCKGCLSNADCGASTACATHLCQNGSCVTENVPSGQGNPGGQTAGDCKKVVCNGSGGTTSVPDDADVASDGKVCTQDLCSGGVPQHPPVAAGTSCGGISTCDGAGNCTCSDPGACNGKCGTLTNACGQQVACPGTCTAPDTCGGGGVSNVCGCVDNTDPCAARDCGTALDACGGSHSCGVCAAGEICKPAGICWCKYPPCELQ